MTNPYKLEGSNNFMPYICHPTVHPNIFFGGGDLFSKECLENFDGILVFAHKGAIYHMADLAVTEGSISIPYILYGTAGDSRRVPTLMKQSLMILKGLDSLAAKGCRRIAFHGGNVSNATYAEGARECIRAIVNWLNNNPNTIDSVTLIDLGDDYYMRFGHLLPWQNGHINRYFSHGSDFETYFEMHFPIDVSSHFNIHNGLADRILNDAQDFIFEDDKFNFSIGVFYMNLIPQAIAKLTGSYRIMKYFLKCAGWPEISCGLGGLMHSDVVLHDNGLFPGDDRLSEWKATVLNELEFFKSFTREVISGDIWLPQSQASKMLSRPSKSLADKTADEIHRLVYEYIKCLDEGTPAPTHIVAGEELHK